MLSADANRPIDHHALSTHGYCAACGIEHTLPIERAMMHCRTLMDQLHMHRRIDFSLPSEKADPRFSTDHLFGRMHGSMFGVLVCENAAGVEVVFKAFSCQYNSVWHVDGWVDPLFDIEAYEGIMNPASGELHRMTDQLLLMDKSSAGYKALFADRKALSQRVMAQLHDLYRVHNFTGSVRTLKECFADARNMPTGTGDCCAPKLLNHAAKSGLKPIALAEFFIGRGTASGSRVDRGFYGPCAEKCLPILGYMLCGGRVDK